MDIPKLLNVDKSIFMKKGIFVTDAREDAPSFFNISKIKKTKIKEFKNSYGKFNNYFIDILEYLEKAKEYKGRNYKDKNFSLALKKFTFKEPPGINLGYGSAKEGKGLSGKTARNTLIIMKKLVDKGIVEPEYFHLIHMFAPNVSVDRLSDMICSIVLPDIKEYTKRMYKELKINIENKKNAEGFYINKENNNPIYLIPEEILDDIPIAKEWSDINHVTRLTKVIKQQVNDAILTSWSKKRTSERKKILLDTISKEKASKIIVNEYKKV